MHQNSRPKQSFYKKNNISIAFGETEKIQTVEVPNAHLLSTTTCNRTRTPTAPPWDVAPQKLDSWPWGLGHLEGEPSYLGDLLTIK